MNPLPVILAFLLSLIVGVCAGGSSQSPGFSDVDDSTHPVDDLISIQLKQTGLLLSPPATPREQIRRAYFDLIGLPPSFSEVQAFEKDPSDENWARILNDLLNRPQYGERQASAWLDLVRFAETNGYERDGPKPEAWRYRDYVIRSFNENKPFDQFIKEQLAGDLIYPQSNEALIATGFYRLHIYDDEPDNSLQADYDIFDDILSTIGSGFLGATISCARCHDHKFDPISQSEYYQFLDFIHRIEPYGKHHTGGGSRPLGKITQPLPNSENDSENKTSPQKVLAVSERPDADSVVTHRLGRGDPTLTEELTPAGFPEFLNQDSERQKSDPSDIRNHRVTLAEWIASPSNPRTAKVIANRIWQSHFGRGIVETPNDFGNAGSGETHMELLNALASQLIQDGWRLKDLHFHIMTSRTYRQSSRATQPMALTKDPSNHLWWRQEMRRMDAEVIRDSMLAFSGGLNQKSYGPSVYPALPVEVHRTQDSVLKGWGESAVEEQHRRSIYIYAKRALPLPFLESFDAGPFAFSMGKRPFTTVAPQALTLLNTDFMQEQAERLAQRVASLEEVFQIVWQRDPTVVELQAAKRSLEILSHQLRTPEASDTGNRTQTKAMTLVCLAILNANETILID